MEISHLLSDIPVTNATVPFHFSQEKLNRRDRYPLSITRKGQKLIYILPKSVAML